MPHENIFSDVSVPAGGFEQLLVDPPWFYNSRQDGETRFGGGARRHYDLIPDAEMLKLPVAYLAADQSMLWLWVTAPRLDFGIDVMTAWGFEYATIGFCWIKYNGPDPHYEMALKPRFPAYRIEGRYGPEVIVKLPKFGVGYYAKSNPEFVLIGRRGKRAMKPATQKVSNLVISPIGEHSEKPEEVPFRIDQMYPHGARIELFARRQRTGWTSWGHGLP